MNRNEIRRQEPSFRDLSVTPKHKSSVIGLDLLAILPPDARDLPPGQRREGVMNNVKIIPEKQQTKDPVRFDNRRAFARSLAPAMLGEATHHAQDKTGVDELRQVLQSRHLEGFGREQQDQGHCDEVANPDAEICQVPGDYLTDFLDKEVRREQERANEEAAQECLIDDEEPSRQVAVVLPILLLTIVRFRIFPRIGEMVVAMVPRMRPAIQLEREPDAKRWPDERATQPARYAPQAMNRFVLQREMPLHDVTREWHRDPPRDVAMQSAQKQPTRVDRQRYQKRRPIVPIEP